MGSKKNKSSDNQLKSIKNRFYIYLSILIIVPLILYFRVINFGFSNIDDATIINTNYGVISNLKNVAQAFTTDAFFSHYTSYYRPLQTVSFMIGAQISGHNPLAYHLTNLLLHILIVVILFIFLKKIGFKEDISFLLALLFSIHPMMTNGACWVPAQGDLFLTLFGLISFLTFIDYYNNRKPITLALHFMAFTLACFSKETALVFPILLLSYFYIFLKKKKSWRDLIPFSFIWGISFLLYFYMRHASVLANNVAIKNYADAFIKNLPAIPITFGKFFLPQDLNTMPIFNNFSIVLGIVVLILLLVLVKKYKAYKNPYLIFGLVWFIVATLPPLIIRISFADVGIEYFEYRAELPFIGLLIITGILFNLSSGLTFNRLLKIFVPVLILFTFISFYHSNDYADNMSFAVSGISSNPNNVYALNLRGIAYGRGNKELAMQDFEKAIKICPVYTGPYYNEGVIYNYSGEELKAEKCYSVALGYDTISPDRTCLPINILYNFAYEEILLKKYDMAKLLLNKALTEFKSNSDIYNNLGFVYISTGVYDSAVYCFTKALEIQPNSLFSYKNRGKAKFSLKDFTGALADYNKALEMDPGTAESWYYTGITKIEVDDFTGAISDLSNAIGMSPSWAEAYFHRGTAYAKENKKVESDKDFEEARKLGFKVN